MHKILKMYSKKRDFINYERMSFNMKKVLAIDLGASSGRGIIAKIEDGKINLKEIHRFQNNGVWAGNDFLWDVLHLLDEIKQAIVKANNDGGFDLIGIDTWGVDYALLDSDGALLTNPVHYRDVRNATGRKEASEVMDIKEIYKKTGIQILDFNTLFQLVYEKNHKNHILENAKTFLFMPDLLNYFLTGVAKNEYTIASTSQMLNPYTKNWDFDLLEKFGINTDIFCDIIMPGKKIGQLSDKVCEELKVKKADVIAVGSHDTASAVVSVPSDKKDFVYISCGTWSLFGTELDEPNITEKGYLSSYTNEGGCGGKIRFLTNIMGLWLIQESRRTYKKEGKDLTFADLEAQARESEPFKCFIDPDYPEFGKPGDIPGRIAEYCKKTGQRAPETIGETVRCIYESLALKYRLALINLEDISGKKFEKINIVGGGTKDPFLCAMTSDACNIDVDAGPVEATALGNIAMCLISAGEIKDIAEARKIIANSFPLKSYKPNHTKEWDEAFERFKKIIEKQ